MPTREVVYVNTVSTGSSTGAVTEKVVSVAADTVTEPVTFTPFVYVMPVAQTTATVNHNLDRDPVGIQVQDEFGEVYDEFSVSYPIPNQQVLVGFDIPIKATIRLM